MSDQVYLPVNYVPRTYQKPFWEYMEGGGTRYVGVWHRRAGKDHTVIAWCSRAAFQRVGTYWHVLPTYSQGRKIIWNGVTGEGRRFIESFPGATDPRRKGSIVKRARDDLMLLELINGSFYQVVGADDPDSLAGPNPVGVVFSEYGLYGNDAVWDLVRPILAENGGWAIFISTPRGRNHYYDLFKRAQAMPSWMTEVHSVDTTKRPDGSPVISPASIEEERATGMSEAWIQQEFYCSWDSPFEGAIWGDEMRQIRSEGRITDVRYDPSLPVETWWDLGINDLGAVWFVQRLGNERRFIDYHQSADWSLEEWCRFVLNKPYIYNRHVGPWDLRAREQSTGMTRETFAAGLGLKFYVSPRYGIADTINEARSFLRKYKCYFDAEKCADGVDALSQYRWKVDQQGNATETPHHDIYSHGSDAFRTGVMSERRESAIVHSQQVMADNAYDIFDPFNQHGRGARQAFAIGSDL